MGHRARAAAIGCCLAIATLPGIVTVASAQTTGTAAIATVSTATTAPTGTLTSSRAPTGALANGSGTHGPHQLSTGAIVLIAAGGLLALLGLGIGFLSWQGLEPAWLLRARHTLGELNFHIGANWAEFADWLRFGR
jgi:hypothetical protein